MTKTRNVSLIRSFLCENEALKNCLFVKLFHFVLRCLKPNFIQKKNTHHCSPTLAISWTLHTKLRTDLVEICVACPSDLRNLL